jgi:hypothetical protein
MHTFFKDGHLYMVGHYVTERAGGQIFEPQFKGLSFRTALQVVTSLNGGGSLGPDLCNVLERCQTS